MKSQEYQPKISKKKNAKIQHQSFRAEILKLKNSKNKKERENGQLKSKKLGEIIRRKIE